jgi:mevalonate kinase
MKSRGAVTDTSTLQKEHHLAKGSQASSARPSGSGGGGCRSVEMEIYEKR